MGKFACCSADGGQRRDREFAHHAAPICAPLPTLRRQDFRSDALVPLCFRSSCQRVLQCITNFGSGALVGTILKPRTCVPLTVKKECSLIYETYISDRAVQETGSDCLLAWSGALNRNSAKQRDGSRTRRRRRGFKQTPRGIPFREKQTGIFA